MWARHVVNRSRRPASRDMANNSPAVDYSPSFVQTCEVSETSQVWIKPLSQWPQLTQWLQWFNPHGERAHRKPVLESRPLGMAPMRFAARMSCAPVYHDPPRSTRACPEEGPGGFSAGELL